MSLYERSPGDTRILHLEITLIENIGCIRSLCNVKYITESKFKIG